MNWFSYETEAHRTWVNLDNVASITEPKASPAWKTPAGPDLRITMTHGPDLVIKADQPGAIAALKTRLAAEMIGGGS